MRLLPIRLLHALPLVATVLAGPAVAAPNLVVELNSGRVLLAEDATRPWNPASTTKMMTAYVALKAVREGRMSMDTPLVASARASAQRPSKIGIRPGQMITLDNALKILMVKSANDLAVVVAEGVAGSLDGFSAIMNAEARRLGMTESTFLNPHGFHQQGHVSSARDLAILARAMLLEFPEHQDLWGIGAVRLGNRVMKNTNGLIGRYPGASGLKTGFVCASGFNVVATATRGTRTLIAVVLGAASGAERTVKTAQLFDQAFAQWGGSEGQSLATLAASGHDSAPNMREEICRRGRSGVVLSDDAENDGAIFQQDVNTQMGDSNDTVYAVFRPSQPSAPAGRSVGSRSASGRPVLGPRAEFEPIPVYLGRAPGSTAVAMGPRDAAKPISAAAAIPAATAAFAPLPGFGANAAPPIRTFGPTARPSAPGQAIAIPATGQPLQLHGAIAPGATGAQRPKLGAIQPTGARPARADAPRAQPPKVAARAQPAKVKARANTSAPRPAAPKTSGTSVQ